MNVEAQHIITPVHIDSVTESALRHFIDRMAGEFDLAGVFLFGSRARGQYRPNSDADVAVLLHGRSGPRVDVALRMADIAFDVLLDTGIVIEAIPFWQDEWAHPEHFSNPALIDNIRREGTRL
jgi:antitoxin ChpS